MGLFSSKPGGTFFGNLLRVAKGQTVAVGGVEVSRGGIFDWLTNWLR